MKIITLNIWGGRVGGRLDDFFIKYADVDVFLLQEVIHRGTDRTVWDPKERANIFNEIQGLLGEHVGIFAPSVYEEWGLAIFIKQSIPIVKYEDIFIYKHRNSLESKDSSLVGRILQHVQVRVGRDDMHFINIHGLWDGGGKGDTDDRLLQSKNIIQYVKNLSGKVIMGGDFNLRPDTSSLRMLEEQLALRNLIMEYNIVSTRTSLYTKPEKFADYVFVPHTTNVRQFSVLPEEVSDHAALLLEI